MTDVPLREATGSRAFDAPQPDSPTYHLHVTSTLWSFLLVLDLRSESGTRLVLIVLPDTMTQASFRALCVACQWIAAHNIRANAEKS